MPEEGDGKPRTGSRSLSLHDKLPVLSDIHRRTEGNISAKFLAEHAARMRAWRQGHTFLKIFFSFQGLCLQARFTSLSRSRRALSRLSSWRGWWGTLGQWGEGGGVGQGGGESHPGWVRGPESQAETRRRRRRWWQRRRPGGSWCWLSPRDPGYILTTICNVGTVPFLAILVRININIHRTLTLISTRKLLFNLTRPLNIKSKIRLAKEL